MIKRVLFISSVFGLIVLFSSIIAFGLFYHTYWYHLKRGLGLDDRGMISLFQKSTQTQIKQTDRHTNFLILGTDDVGNRENDPLLTDTMMLVSIDLLTTQVRAISLPRDLWSKEYKTKINALYEYGKERNPEHPEEFPTQVISEMTDIPIHYTVVISLDDLKTLIDILGGVDVNVKKGFLDTQFPKTDVDIRTEKDPARLYQTIEFQSGQQVMSGERALQYIRSRKSADQEIGTDDSRAVRQQELVIALLNKFQDRSIVTKPALIEEVIRWYKNGFERYFSVEELLSLSSLFGYYPSGLQLHTEQLSIESETSPGVIFHPSVLKYNVWVYEVKNEEQFRQELFTKLGLPVQ